jgi:hypothetical protein
MGSTGHLENGHEPAQIHVAPKGGERMKKLGRKLAKALKARALAHGILAFFSNEARGNLRIQEGLL